ncbi:MAG: FKBP-type peptidyl-prolyl cis-trans isomerase [Bacteroidia bacterium]|jgi:FKBP-type peptidyl-prolyl cis-trans isomerase SlyD|nr:FKBP-type peptidyl-prolyl cis-trans isomerase [Bacteroidia bacterium]
MTIENNTVVSVNYLLAKKGTGEQIEQTSKEHPFVFIFGAGGLLEDFETNLRNKKVGDTFDFFIEHTRGYGVRDEQHIVMIPIDAFLGEDGNLDEENVKVGVTLPMIDNEGGKLYGMVKEITKEYVKMDFNHPLAGQDLHFKGEVLEVRAASEEELAHGHVHGEHGHHH